MSIKEFSNVHATEGTADIEKYLNVRTAINIIFNRIITNSIFNL